VRARRLLLDGLQLGLERVALLILGAALLALSLELAAPGMWRLAYDLITTSHLLPPEVIEVLELSPP
jgi:hypothetical protein